METKHPKVDNGQNVYIFKDSLTSHFFISQIHG